VFAAKNSTRASPASTAPGIVTTCCSRLPTVLAAPTNAIGLATLLGLICRWTVWVAPSSSVTVRETVRGPAAG
jgi:hypothetical protein